MRWKLENRECSVINVKAVFSFNDKKNVEGKSRCICLKCCLVKTRRGKRIPLPMAAAFGAKDLPHTMLSDHIEQRLFRHLQEEREEKAKVTGKNMNEENNYQFDSLPQAKHNSMMILYYLCPPFPPILGINCAIFHKGVPLCGVCNAWYQRDDGRSHKLRLPRRSSVVDHFTGYEETDQPSLLVCNVKT